MSIKRAYAEINLDNIVHNLYCFKDRINENTKIIAVIKADGYGHGAMKIAERIENLDFLFGFSVATCEEAIELRNAGIKKPIVILGYTFNEDMSILVEENVSMAVFTEDMAENMNETAKKLGKKASVHIKLDTGMGRIGIRPDESGVEFVKKLSKYSNISIDGMFTHFATADETDKTKAKAQFDKYMNFCKKLSEEGIEIPVKHVSNSASIIDLKEFNLDVVRAGIILYGLWPSDEVSKNIDIRPALSLKSSISYIKELHDGDEISYGGTYKVKGTKRIATIPLGYADGIPRSLSNKGFVLINGRKAYITGRVCMDQFMVDITDIDAKILDEVVIIGTQKGESVTAEEVGDISGRFNYELVCDISKRVSRIYK